jgi:hypothetical protein
MDAKQGSGAICRSDDVMRMVGMIGASAKGLRRRHANRQPMPNALCGEPHPYAFRNKKRAVCIL